MSAEAVTVEPKAAAEPKAIKSEGTPKRIERLPLESLSIDRSYQRPISQKMERMGKNWNQDLAQIITVSVRDDGSFWIVDGQHRVGAALIAGQTHLEADIREGLTIEEEAKLFDELNNTRSHVTALDRFKARLVYNDPEALDIKSIVENEFGGVIADSHGRANKHDRRIRAVASLERVYKYEGPNGFREILTIIKGAWGDLDVDNVNEWTLGGMRQVMARQRKNLDVNRLIERLKAEDISNLRRKAHAHIQIFGGSGPMNFYRAVVETYNHNLTARHRLRA